MLPATHFYSWYSYSKNSRFIPGIIVIPGIIYSSFQEPAPDLLAQWVERRKIYSGGRRFKPQRSQIFFDPWQQPNFFKGVIPKGDLVYRWYCLLLGPKHLLKVIISFANYLRVTREKMATRFASVISKEIAHYSPKWRWLAVTIDLAASRLGK